MVLRRIGFIISLLVFFGSIYLLVTASPVLLYPLSEALGLPMGTLTTWLGFLSLPAMAYFAFPNLLKMGTPLQKGLRAAWIIGLLLAVCWPFLSYLLAANWSFNFVGPQEAFRGSDRAGVYFDYLNLLTLLWPLLVLIGLTLDRIWGRLQRR